MRRPYKSYLQRAACGKDFIASAPEERKHNG
jgi:hypothetical protein